MIKLNIPGIPIAQKRPRFARRGKFVKTYSEQETEAGKFAALCLNQIASQIEKPLEGPLRFDMIAYLPRPKSHYGTGKNRDTLKPTAPKYPHMDKKDLTNIAKFCEDCLNGIAWVDDRQIVGERLEKRYCEWDTNKPRVIMQIWSLS